MVSNRWTILSAQWTVSANEADQLPQNSEGWAICERTDSASEMQGDKMAGKRNKCTVEGSWD